MMAASGSGGNNLMTYHEFVAAEQLQQAAEGKRPEHPKLGA